MKRINLAKSLMIGFSVFSLLGVSPDLEANTDQALPSSEFFHAEKIADNITRIRGLAGELMYLIEGQTKAALIDTGIGVGNLREFIEKLTSLPVFVLITHGHVDHAFGAANFDDVYMNHADDSLYQEHSDMNVRIGFLQSQYADYAKIKPVDFVVSKPSSAFKELKDGDCFDLGGTTLEVYQAAGHTPGSMAILLKEPRILLTGDAANNFTFLFDNRAAGIASYQKTMKTLLSKTDGKFDKIYLSHGSGDAPKALLAEIITLCDDIQAGKVDDVPFSFMGMNAFIAKKVENGGSRVDGGFANIVYSKEKVNQ